VSSRQLGWQQQMPDAHTSWDCVEAQRGNDAWQNKDVVNWPTHCRLECSSPSSTREPCDMKAFMHHRQELELHSFWQVKPMKVDMHFVSLTRRAATCNMCFYSIHWYHFLSSIVEVMIKNSVCFLCPTVYTSKGIWRVVWVIRAVGGCRPPTKLLKSHALTHKYMYT